MRRWALACLIAFLAIPYTVLAIHIPGWSFPDIADFKTVLFRSLIQASLSAFFSVVIGFFGAAGLISLRGKSRNLMDLFFLIPNFLPVLFVILSCLILISPFPFGMVGVVMAHVLVNSGLVAFALSRKMDLLGTQLDLALIDGASRGKIYTQVVAPQLKQDMANLFVTVFALSFSSLSIPMILGGLNPSTLEIFIYQKIRNLGEWGQALGLAGVQSLILIVLAYVFRKVKTVKTTKKNMSPAAIEFLGLRFAVLPLAAMSAMIAFAPALMAVTHPKLNLPGNELLTSVMGTVTVGLGAGLFFLFLFSVLAYAFPEKRAEKFIIAYVPPSSVLVGFAFLLLPLHSVSSIVVLVVALTLILFPVLMRLGGFQILNNLRSDFESAELLGGSNLLIFRKILLPQYWPGACRLAGLCSFWACGDFAVSNIILGKNITLTLLIQSLMQNYRIDQASVLIWLFMLVGGAVYLTFVGLGRVAR